MSRVTEPFRFALSGLLLAGEFVRQPEVWPGFVAFVERNTGKQWQVTPDSMATAVTVGAALREELEGDP